MKKMLMMTALPAVLLTALLAALTLGGCPAEADEPERWSFSVTNAQVYGTDRTTHATVSGDLRFQYINPSGADTVSATVVGSITDGRVTFALPDPVDSSELAPIFAAFAGTGTVDPPSHHALFALGFKIYNGSEYLGDLQYRTNSGGVGFLYSEEPLTVVVVDPDGHESFDLRAASGWNCLLFNGEGMVTGNLPPDAKWVFMPESDE